VLASVINEKDSGDTKSIIEDDINSNIMELDDLLKALDAKSDFPAKEYLHIEEESDLYSNMDDESILNSVQSNVEDDEDLIETIIEPITFCQGKLGLETLKTFTFQKKNATNMISTAWNILLPNSENRRGLINKKRLTNGLMSLINV